MKQRRKMQLSRAYNTTIKRAPEQTALFYLVGRRSLPRVCLGCAPLVHTVFAGVGAGACEEGRGRETKTGVIPIETEKRVDWNAIRAEYIGGGISQRKLAKKYGVSETTLMKKANKEGWQNHRKEADSRSTAMAQQKTAEAAADNATIAENIKKTMLLRLQRIAENYPRDATEVRRKEDGAYCLYKIKDLAEAYKALTEDIPKVEENKNAPIYELLRKLDGECDVQ